MTTKLSVKTGAFLLFSLGFSVVLGNGRLLAAPPDRSISASRQFIIYGTTRPLRGAIAEVAEKTKANVLNVLQQRDEWKLPIILSLQFPQANLPELPPAALRFSQTGAGLKIQIDLTIANDFDPLAVRREILRGILLEMIYRHAPNLPAGSAYTEPPAWLIEGLLGAAPVHDRDTMLDAVASLVAQDQIAGVEEFLQQKFELLDPSGQLLYRAYALAFLQLLVNESGGAVRLGSYLTGLSLPTADPVADLRTYFPVLSRSSEVDAMWKASVASLTTRRYELFTAAETERQLYDLLGPAETRAEGSRPNVLLKFTKKGVAPAEWNELRQLKDKLLLLGMQANPTLRGLVMQYELLAERLLKHKPKGVAVRLERLGAQRGELTARISQIDDYMNWYEATKADTISGAFAGYLRSATQLDETPTRRRDPISVYLDALEEQF